MKTSHTIQSSRNKGFTLIELLVVIAIITILAVIVFVALNPSQRFSDTRDAKRVSDVNTLLTAIHASIVDNKGTLPAGLSTGMLETQIGTATSSCAIATGGCAATAAACVNLTTPMTKYLKSIPVDPDGGDASRSAYSVTVDSNNIVTIKACGTEGSVNISASR